MGRKSGSGFTLIELMLAASIIGLLAAVAIPRFANMIIKAQEAANKGHLGALRSAVTIYYADNEGTPPQYINGLTSGGKYISGIPNISIPTFRAHPASDVAWSWNALFDWPWDFDLRKHRGWYHRYRGLEVHVACTHPDSTGRIWSTW